MATNLRLRPDAEEAVRREAARTGRSQQEVIREAVDQYLELPPPDRARSEAESLVAAGVVLPARSPFRQVSPSLSLPEGKTSLDLLDRANRL